jgi:hypothetical protein
VSGRERLALDPMAKVGSEVAKRPQQVVMPAVRLGESIDDAQHRFLGSEQARAERVVVCRDAEVPIQKAAEAFELNAGGVGCRQRRQLADDRRACPRGAGGGGRVPAIETRSEAAVDPAVGQRLEAIGIAAVVAVVERGVERGDVEPIDRALAVRRRETKVR